MIPLTNNQDPNKKTHWFHLGYMVPTLGNWVPVSVDCSYVKRILCKQAMEALREINGLPPNAVLMSISYLGLASKHYMAGTSDKPVPSKLSDAYRQGLTVALTTQVAREELVNPYTAVRDQSTELALFESEWQAGLQEGHSIMDAQKEIPAPVIET